MTAERFEAITSQYSSLRIAVVGDFCLDRYLEIDPARQETSVETGLPVHNVVRVRAQPGGAGTIVNNLSALRIGAIFPIGFAGEDGEGYELWHALEACPRVRLDYFIRTAQRRTFTYCKPLLLSAGKAPTELNRFDLKNWTPTPSLLQGLLAGRLQNAATCVDAIIVLNQAEVAETGVISQKVLETLERVVAANADLLVLADSRRGLRGFPAAVFKMNAAELAALRGKSAELSLDQIKDAAGALAHHNRRSVFVTLSAEGILGATALGEVQHLPALPVHGEIDVVGAGDAVSANLTAAMAAHATLREALELANAAGSVVIHKLGTTGTASLAELRDSIIK